MLYEVTVVDTDEHPPDHGSSSKYNNAKHFGTFICEAPVWRRFVTSYGPDEDLSCYRMPVQVVEFALEVSQQYLTSATHNRTVLVEISYVTPKRVGYKNNTSWTQRGLLSSFLLNSAQLKRRTDDESRYLRSLSTLN